MEPLLTVAVVLVLITGLVYSPLTSLSKVSVVGAHPEDRAEIESRLAAENNIPWLKVRNRDVESEIQQIQAVDHANYSQNIFGRGRLEVVYRVPVAKVKGDTLIGLDAQGILFKTGSLPDGIPVVILSDKAKELPLAMAGGFPGGYVAYLAIQARQIDTKDPLVIWFNEKQYLCLNMGSAMIVFGGCDMLDAKLRALREMLDQQPDLLTKLDSLNLIDSSHPAKTYKKQRE